MLVLCAPTFGAAAVVRDNLYGTSAVSPTEAWIVGTFGSIYHTIDAGKSWQRQESGTKLPLFSVDFADAKTGWAVGRSAVVLHTTDGGRTWQKQESGIPTDKHLFRVQALDAKTAWAVGDWGAIAMTRDGGQTWQNRSLGSLVVREEQEPGRRVDTITDDVILYDVSFPDARHGYISGEFGTVLASEDGGETWTRRHTPTEKTLFGIHFTRSGEGWAVGMDGLVMHTTDGGHTWNVQHGEPRSAAVDEISFVESMKNPGMYGVSVDGRYGVVVGDVGMLLVSSDGGRTWTRQVLPEQDRLVWMRDVNLLPGAHGFLVGANGFSARIDDDRVTVPETGEAAAPVP